MGKIYKFTCRQFLALFIVLTVLPLQELFAQTYNDGPILLEARLRDFNLTFSETDLAIFGVVGQPDDLTYYVRARDNGDEDGAGYTSTTCLTEDYDLPLCDWLVGGAGCGGGPVATIFSHPYTGAVVPQFIDIGVDLWEDESPDQLLGVGCQGTRCAYETGFCCGGVLFGACLGVIDDDDLHCVGDPYATLDYRLGSPCEWYDHGYLSGNCNIPSNDVYHPRIETFWRYTRGNDCATPIDLGNVQPGFANISHFNSNICYGDNNAFANGGQDVFYQINVTQPTGVLFRTCGTGSANTSVVILDQSCNQIYSNFSGCGSGAQIAVPLCQPGVYYVVVEGRLGDTGTFTLEIQEDPSVIVSSNAGPNVFVCEGLGVQIGGTAPNTATGGQGPYTYQWSSPTFLTDDTIANPVAFPPSSQDFYVTVTDNLGCVSIDTVTVTVNPGPTPALGPDQDLCPGTPTTLDAGAGFSTYFWSTGSFNQQVTVNSSGQYIAVVSDFNGCIGRDTVNVNYYPTPNINLGVDTSICTGENITFDAGAGFNTYAWNNSSITQTVTVAAAGDYEVTGTDPNGCLAADTITLGIDPLPVVNLGADTTVCPGEPGLFDPGPGFLGYSWTGGSINQTLSPTATGNYSVTVTDINGCENNDDINLFNFTPTAPTITGVNQICPGGSTLLDAGTGPAANPYVTYLWNTGDATQTINAMFPGTYMVTVTDGNGCETMDNITVTQATVPFVDLEEDTTICQGSPLVITPVSVTAGVAYSWSTGGSGPAIVVTTAGQYSVTVTNAAGCIAIDTMDVFVSPLPTPTALNNVSICPTDSVLLDPGAGFSTYAWSTGDNSQAIFVSQPGNYDVTVTNAAGCTATTSMTLSQFGAVNVTLGGDRTECDGVTFNLNASNPGSTFNWNTGATTQSISVSFPGQYAVTVTSPDGCTASDTMEAFYNPLPTVDLGADDTLCTGGTTTLDAGPGFNAYAWSNGDATQTSTVNTTGTYEVTVTDANGCQNSDDIEVIANTIPQVDLGPDVTFCDSGSVLLDAGPQYVAYQWTPAMSINQYAIVDLPGNYSVTVTDQFDCVSTDDINVSIQTLQDQDFLPPLYEFCEGEEGLVDAGDQWEYYEWNSGEEDQYLIVSASGSHDIIVTDSNGCRYFDTIRVEEILVPTLELGPNQDICPDEIIALDPGSGFDSYIWSTSETTPTIEIDAAGIYTVQATFQNCVRTDDIEVGDLCPGQVFIPNVFSPNGDDINDIFSVTYVNLDDLTVQIYDRWGKFLFESNDKNFQWDGRFNGNPLPEGVYYFVMEYKLAGSEVIEQEKGTVTLIR